jgi:flavin-binding protein dodecin
MAATAPRGLASMDRWGTSLAAAVALGVVNPRIQSIVASSAISKETAMTVARITEISSISSKSFEDAVVQGVERANKTLRNVKGAWVKEQEVNIDNGKITGYKVILKVTFVLGD